jgi:hypothetical protein
MPFTIVTVCVNYLDFLEPAYEQNKLVLSNHYYWVITSSADFKTQEFCQKNNIKYYITDSFYKNGNPFNKGAAINSLFLESDQFKACLNNSDWVLMIDSDIIVKSLLDIAWDFHKDKNCLYSCGRKIYNTKNDYLNKKYIQGGCHFLGYFQLFHKDTILFYTDRNQGFLYEFRNGSYYDCEFAKRFECQKCLPEDVDHIGPAYLNWDGRISELWEK